MWHGADVFQMWTPPRNLQPSVFQNVIFLSHFKVLDCSFCLPQLPSTKCPYFGMVVSTFQGIQIRRYVSTFQEIWTWQCPCFRRFRHGSVHVSGDLGMAVSMFQEIWAWHCQHFKGIFWMDCPHFRKHGI